MRVEEENVRITMLIFSITVNMGTDSKIDSALVSLSGKSFI